MLIFLVLLSLTFDNIWSIQKVDQRCSCRCPVSSATEIAVYIDSNVVEASKCKCELIVPEEKKPVCSLCTCTFEIRNIILVKSIVLITLILIGLLGAYTVFYVVFIERKCSQNVAEVCISDDDPLIEEANADPNYVTSPPIPHRAPKNMYGLFQQRVNRWHRQVKAQRDHVYYTKSILN